MFNFSKLVLPASLNISYCEGKTSYSNRTFMFGNPLFVPGRPIQSGALLVPTRIRWFDKVIKGNDCFKEVVTNEDVGVGLTQKGHLYIWCAQEFIEDVANEKIRKKLAKSNHAIPVKSQTVVDRFTGTVVDDSDPIDDLVKTSIQKQMDGGDLEDNAMLKMSMPTKMRKTLSKDYYHLPLYIDFNHIRAKESPLYKETIVNVKLGKDILLVRTSKGQLYIIAIKELLKKKSSHRRSSEESAIYGDYEFLNIPNDIFTRFYKDDPNIFYINYFDYENDEVNNLESDNVIKFNDYIFHVELPENSQIWKNYVKQFSVGHRHFGILDRFNRIYMYGHNNCGQCGELPSDYTRGGSIADTTDKVFADALEASVSIDDVCEVEFLDEIEAFEKSTGIKVDREEFKRKNDLQLKHWGIDKEVKHVKDELINNANIIGINIDKEISEAKKAQKSNENLISYFKEKRDEELKNFANRPKEVLYNQFKDNYLKPREITDILGDAYRVVCGGDFTYIQSKTNAIEARDFRTNEKIERDKQIELMGGTVSKDNDKMTLKQVLNDSTMNRLNMDDHVDGEDDDFYDRKSTKKSPAELELERKKNEVIVTRRKVQDYVPDPNTGAMIDRYDHGYHTVSFGDDSCIQLGLGDTRLKSSTYAEKTYSWIFYQNKGLVSHTRMPKTWNVYDPTKIYEFYEKHFQFYPQTIKDFPAYARPDYPPPNNVYLGSNFAVFRVVETPLWNSKENTKNCLFAVGSNFDGECGRVRQSGHQNVKKVILPENEDIVDVVCGEHHSLALLSRGGVYSWGKNTWGQLGIGHRGNVCPPKQIFGPGMLDNKIDPQLYALSEAEKRNPIAKQNERKYNRIKRVCAETENWMPYFMNAGVHSSVILSRRYTHRRNTLKDESLQQPKKPVGYEGGSDADFVDPADHNEMSVPARNFIRSEPDAETSDEKSN